MVESRKGAKRRKNSAKSKSKAGTGTKTRAKAKTGSKAKAVTKAKTRAKTKASAKAKTRAKSAKAGRSTASAKKKTVSTPRRASTRPKRPARIPSDGKLYYRIGEVAELTGIKPHVLRYWETEFRWMAPPKSRSKQRLYRRKDIEMVHAIKKLLYEERYTIAGARQQLRELGLTGRADMAAEETSPKQSEVSAAAQGLRANYKQIRGELVQIRALL